MLQVERPTSIGWLCYSTKEMVSGALADEIEDTLDLKVGLRWETINNNTKRDLKEKEKVFALEVETDREDKDVAQRRLLRFYNSVTRETKDFPNGIRLRFVKPYMEAVNSREKAKINALRNRQAEFLNMI